VVDEVLGHQRPDPSDVVRLERGDDLPDQLSVVFIPSPSRSVEPGSTEPAGAATIMEEVLGAFHPGVGRADRPNRACSGRLRTVRRTQLTEEGAVRVQCGSMIG
jgi:hypothetical protein